MLNHYQHGTSPSNHLSDLNWKSPAAIQVRVLPPWGKGGGAFVAAATPSPLLTSPLPFHTRSGSAWALEAFPGKPSYKRTAPASSPSPRQAPGDGYRESRCQDGLEPAGESRRARTAPATPRPGSPTSGIRSSQVTASLASCPSTRALDADARQGPAGGGGDRAAGR